MVALPCMHHSVLLDFVYSGLQWKQMGNRCASSVAKPSLSRGDKQHGYTVQRVIPVPELSLTAIYLQHTTGAQHLHVERQDSNNVFGYKVLNILVLLSK